MRSCLSPAQKPPESIHLNALLPPSANCRFFQGCFMVHLSCHSRPQARVGGREGRIKEQPMNSVPNACTLLATSIEPYSFHCPSCSQIMTGAENYVLTLSYHWETRKCMGQNTHRGKCKSELFWLQCFSSGRKMIEFHTDKTHTLSHHTGFTPRVISEPSTHTSPK